MKLIITERQLTTLTLCQLQQLAHVASHIGKVYR